MHTDSETPHSTLQINYRVLLRNFVIEIVIYGSLITAYYFVALRLVASPLSNLFTNNLSHYAIIGLVLIVAQAMLLDRLTTYLLERLGLQRFE